MTAVENLAKIGRPGRGLHGPGIWHYGSAVEGKGAGSGPERSVYPVAMPVSGMRGGASMHI